MSNANQNNENQKLAQQPNDKEQIGAADAPTMAFPAGFQAIATAYGDYTKKSFDKVVEIQTDFAKSAFETFVAESQKIGALYSDLAKQSYKPFAGFVAKMTPTNQ